MNSMYKCISQMMQHTFLASTYVGPQGSLLEDRALRTPRLLVVRIIDLSCLCRVCGCIFAAGCREINVRSRNSSNWTRALSRPLQIKLRIKYKIRFRAQLRIM